METILSKQSFDWFDKSKRELQLFQTFFSERTKIEKKIKSQWMAFSLKWRDKFKDSLKEATLPTSAESTVFNITTMLVGELLDNANICGKGLSIMENERCSPSAILKRWLADPLRNTTCLEVDDFKSTFNNTIKDLAKCEEDVEEAKQVVQRIFEAYHISKVDETNIKEVKAKRDREKRMRMAKEAYQQAVKDHKEMEGTFMKEMTHLREGLESYEKNRISVLKKSLSVYQTAINEHGKEREFREKRMDEMKEYFNIMNGFSVENDVKQRLNSMKQPFVFGDYPIDPFRDEDVIQDTTYDFQLEDLPRVQSDGKVTVKNDRKKRNIKNFLKKNKQKKAVTFEQKKTQRERGERE